MSPINRSYILFCILFTVCSFGAGVDIFSPALPTVTRIFDSHLVQLAIGMYVLGYGIGQGFVGPFADSLGRKKILYFGLVFYILAAVLAGFSTNVSMLLVTRFIQGFALAAPAVVCRAMLADIYNKKELPIAMNYYTMFWSLGPVVAPFIGGYLTHYIDWSWTLFFLAAYLFLSFLLFLKVPETHKNRQPLAFGHALKSYGEMIKHPAYIGAIFAVSVFYALILNFNVVGPFLIEHRLGYSPVTFGYCALILGIAIFLGSYFNKILLKKHDQIVCMNYVAVISLIASIVMLAISLSGVINLYVIFIPTFFLFFASGMLFGSLYGVPVQIFPHMAGKAGGLMGALFVTGAGIIGSLASLLSKTDQTPLAISNLAIVVLGLLVYWITVRKCFLNKRKSS